MSAEGPSRGANRSPLGGSAAATTASVGVVQSAPHDRPKEGSLPLGGKARSAKGAHNPLGACMDAPAQVFVYYHVIGDTSVARLRTGNLFAAVEARTGAVGQLMRRCDDPQTWMEVYAPVHDLHMFCVVLDECVGQLNAEQNARDGMRHLECFTGLALSPSATPDMP